MTTSPRPAAPTAATVGGYRLLTRIGEGGMGVVHLAQGPDGRRAALKVLRPNVVGDDESRRRLAQEVESLQHVRSSNVAEILDADPWGDVPFVVTRFVPGHSLHAAVEHDGPLSGRDLEHAARGLLTAVRDVHAVGVLHRDIKPTNVVMEGRSPILIDFGLARLAEDPRLTATGWLMGTPGYLAPEVLVGDSATTATDVHGWAATLVYAATGRSPYGRGHVMTILDRTRRGEIDLTGVPEPLRPILAAALASQPHERPTVPEAMAALESLAAGPPTAPWPVAARSAPSPSPTTPLTHNGAAAAVPVQAQPTRPYTVVAPVQPTPGSRPPGPPGQQSGASGAPAYPPAGAVLPERTTGSQRFRRSLLLLAVATLVVVCFGTAPYVTAGLLGLAVLLARGVSHGRQAAWQRRSLRGRRWFDGLLALLSYPWHVLRGSLGGAVLLLAAAAVTAVAVAATWLSGRTPEEALLVGGGALVISTWVGPGAARLRDPVGRAATGIARYASVWWLSMAAILVLTAAWWWTGAQGGIMWEPASGPPVGSLRDLAELVGLRGSTL